jgi:outer membrane receptor protein involved in Fe transport
VRLRVERKLGQLNFSSFVSQADLKNAIVNAGNPDLRPDQHWQFEAALEQRFWGKGSIVITGLHEELTDVADYTPLVGSNPPIDGPGNIGKGTSDQLDIEGTVPLDRLGILGGQLKTTTIWRISEVTDPVTHQSRRISGQRPDVLQGTFQQDLPQWKSTWSLTYFKGWRETYYRLGEIDRYHIGNQYMQFEWDYKPTSDLLISAQLDNLLPFKFSRHRTVWDGSRAVDPVLFDDYRTVQSQPRLYLKVRKTF